MVVAFGSLEPRMPWENYDIWQQCLWDDVIISDAEEYTRSPNARPMPLGLYARLDHSIARPVWLFHDHDLCISLDGWEELGLDDIRIWWVTARLNVMWYYTWRETGRRSTGMCRVPEMVGLQFPVYFYFLSNARYRHNRLCRGWWVLVSRDGLGHRNDRDEVLFIRSFTLGNWHHVFSRLTKQNSWIIGGKTSLIRTKIENCHQICKSNNCNCHMYASQNRWDKRSCD